MGMWEDYEARLTVNGDTERESIITVAKDSFSSQIVDNPAYRASSTRNGTAQAFVIQAQKKTPYKADVFAMPGDSLYSGDLIENEGEHWLVVDTNTTNPIQVTGTAWLCNQLFKFQNGTTAIVEKYGVFDDGTYSLSKDNQIVTLSNKTSFYLPQDNDTKSIFTTKRLATDIIYNKSGEKELLCWSVSGINPRSKNYGTGSHLLELIVDSNAYNATKDSIENMVCDYITSSSGGSTGELLPCSITTARSSIRTGTSYTYAVTFYKADGVTVDDTVVAVWTISPAITGVTSTPNGNSIQISVANNDDLVGSTFVLSVTDSGGLYNTTTYKVEVV